MNNILFLDIETVPKVWNFNELDERTQGIFKRKYRKDIDEYLSKYILNVSRDNPDKVYEATNAVWQENAAFHAEFCKIICVSIGQVRISLKPGPPSPQLAIPSGSTDKELNPAPTIEVTEIATKSFYNHNEKMLIQEVVVFLEKNYSFELCAHNGKGFDFGMLTKKVLIYRFKLPPQLEITGLKPWEIKLLDTAEMWRFGNMKDYVSLDSIANCFGLPSPKETMDGSMVGPTYYGVGVLEGTHDKDAALKKICIYCEFGDVVTLVNVYRCIKGMEPVLLHKSLTL